MRRDELGDMRRQEKVQLELLFSLASQIFLDCQTFLPYRSSLQLRFFLRQACLPFRSHQFFLWFLFCQLSLSQEACASLRLRRWRRRRQRRLDRGLRRLRLDGRVHPHGVGLRRVGAAAGNRDDPRRLRHRPHGHAGSHTGTGLHRDRVALGDDFFDCFRGRRHPGLAGNGFGGDAYVHENTPLNSKYLSIVSLTD